MIVRVGGRELETGVVLMDAEEPQRGIVEALKTAGGVAVPILVLKGLKEAFRAVPVYASSARGSSVANSGAWNEVLTTAMEIADWLCVGVIIFAGAIWMFNNRTKAIEQIIGGSSGYLVIRHAKDIQEWLHTI